MAPRSKRKISLHSRPSTGRKPGRGQTLSIHQLFLNCCHVSILHVQSQASIRAFALILGATKTKLSHYYVINSTWSTGQRHVWSTLALEFSVWPHVLPCTHPGAPHSGSCRTKSSLALTGCPVDPKRKRSATPMPSYSNIITPHPTGAFRGGSLSSRCIFQVDGERFWLYSWLNPV